MDNPGPLTSKQETALSVLLKRDRTQVRTLVEDARDNFAASAPDYVKIHRDACEAGLESGDPKGFAVAASGAQWALENMSFDGARVVDPPKKDKGPSGPRILIGVKVGGVDQPATVVELPKEPSNG